MVDRDGPPLHLLEETLERVERQMYVDLYAALPETVAREHGIAWHLDDACLRLTCSEHDRPYLNRVMIVCAPSDPARRLDEIIEHYREAGVARWMMQIPPACATPELSRRLVERELAPLRAWAKHAGAVDAVSARLETPSCDLRVEAIDRGRADDWSSVLAPVFDFPQGSESWLAATVGRPGWRHYLALDGDQPAACAALFVSDGIAILGFAATLPSHRRRGAQTALVAARVRDALRLGVDWLVTETDEELPDRPNPSYRNIVRAGMPVRYVRPNWGPPPA